MFPAPETLDSIAADLARQGWAVREDFWPRPLVAAAAREIADMRGAGRFRAASVGPASSAQLAPEIRGDGTCWFEPGSLAPAQAEIWSALERLRESLNRALFLGLWELEGHYAVYPPGAFYRKHLDRFRSDSRRAVSVVAFFNEDWAEEDGGALAMDIDEGACLVWPRAGTLVVFLSDRVAHEVRETRRERLSFAGWFKTR